MNSGSDVTLERTLPNSIESERAVLGAIILGHKAILPATEVLTAEDFYLEGHREIFRAMLARRAMAWYVCLRISALAPPLLRSEKSGCRIPRKQGMPHFSYRRLLPTPYSTWSGITECQVEAERDCGAIL